MEALDAIEVIIRSIILVHVNLRVSSSAKLSFLCVARFCKYLSKISQSAYKSQSCVRNFSKYFSKYFTFSRYWLMKFEYCLWSMFRATLIFNKICYDVVKVVLKNC